MERNDMDSSKGLKGRDKGMAPEFRQPGDVPAYGVVNQPKDSMGESVSSTHYSFNRKEGGNVNTVDSVKTSKSGDVD
jgi:hypothetical protein